MRAQPQDVRKTSSELILASRARLDSLGSGRREPDELAEQRLAVLKAALDGLPEVARSARDIFVSAAETYRVAKELDAMVEQYRIAASTSLERLRVLAPIMERQLDRASDRVDQLLAQVAAIDPRTCTQEDLDCRGSLLQCARESSRQITQLLMRLMSI